MSGSGGRVSMWVLVFVCLENVDLFLQTNKDSNINVSYWCFQWWKRLGVLGYFCCGQWSRDWWKACSKFWWKYPRCWAIVSENSKADWSEHEIGETPQIWQVHKQTCNWVIMFSNYRGVHWAHCERSGHESTAFPDFPSPNRWQLPQFQLRRLLHQCLGDFVHWCCQWKPGVGRSTIIWLAVLINCHFIWLFN